MIRFDNLPPEVMQAMITPMHQILPPSPPHHSPSHPHPHHTGALYLGSLSAVQDAAALKQQGITHLVQVLDVPWLPVSEKDGFDCYKIEIHDEASVDLKPYLEGVCAYIARALGQGRNVLVHCQQGISRSPAIVMAYLMRAHGMSYSAAFAYVHRKRACVKPNSGFVKALQDWEGLLSGAGGAGAGGGGGGGAGGAGAGAGARPGFGRRFTT